MAIYHLTAKTGSRNGGQSAKAKADYIQREGRYSRDRDEVLHTQSGHLPEWAERPSDYWDAADLYERANGRLFKEVEFALPVELTLDQQRELVDEFARHLTEGERLPYTLAIHAGNGENPHCHLMISERKNDGIERPADQWFKRYNAKQPERGGAQKSESLKPKEWLEQTREAWSHYANRALERAGVAERIDHRSLADQGITDREPQTHMGQHAIAVERKTGELSRRRKDWQAAVQARAQEAAQQKIEEAQIAAELAAAEQQVEILGLDLAELELDERIKLRSAPQPERLPRAPARASADIRRDLDRARERFKEPAAIADRSDAVMKARKRAIEAQRKFEEAELVASKRRNLVEDGRQRLRSTRKQLSDWKREHPFLRWWHEHVRPVKSAQKMERTITNIMAKLPKAERAAIDSTESLKQAQLASIKAQNQFFDVRQQLIERLEEVAKHERLRIKQLEKQLVEALEREKPKQEPEPPKAVEQAQPVRWVNSERSEPGDDRSFRRYERPRG